MKPVERKVNEKRNNDDADYFFGFNCGFGLFPADFFETGGRFFKFFVYRRADYRRHGFARAVRGFYPAAFCQIGRNGDTNKLLNERLNGFV